MELKEEEELDEALGEADDPLLPPLDVAMLAEELPPAIVDVEVDEDVMEELRVEVVDADGFAEDEPLDAGELEDDRDKDVVVDTRELILLVVEVRAEGDPEDAVVTVLLLQSSHPGESVNSSVLIIKYVSGAHPK